MWNVKYLCLAYGDEEGWLSLSKEEQVEVLAADAVLQRRGAYMATVGNATTVTAWDGKPSTAKAPFAESKVLLVGFSIIEAVDLDEAVRLVAGTPCARAKGAIEVRQLSSAPTSEAVIQSH